RIGSVLLHAERRGHHGGGADHQLAGAGVHDPGRAAGGRAHAARQRAGRHDVHSVGRSPLRHQL
ncbi:hypothetical protein IWW54_006631, partial [Coemansia sp. RSA 2705]